MSIIRRCWTALATLLVAVALTTVAATSASAANGGNPQTSGCAASAVTLRTVNLHDAGTHIGSASLRYSRDCQTQWTTVNWWGSYSASPSVWVQNQSGTDLYAAYRDGTSAYTNQLTGMRYTAGCGGTHVYRSNGSHVGWFYIGCA